MTDFKSVDNRKVHEAARSREYQAMHPEKRSYTVYRFNAKKRGYEFHLTYGEFAALIEMPCHYCGHKSIMTLNGIDRVNNRLGYTVDNTVPCCTNCNLMKRDQVEAQYISHCLAVVRYQAQKEGLLEYKSDDNRSG